MGRLQNRAVIKMNKKGRPSNKERQEQGEFDDSYGESG